LHSLLHWSTITIRIEYDEAKDLETQRRHGFPLSAGALVIEQAAEFELDESTDEVRWRAYAWVNGRAMMCVYTMRPNASHRIISVRKATKKEIVRWLAPSG
jgi:uncharacterized DUF497 family protein